MAIPLSPQETALLANQIYLFRTADELEDALKQNRGKLGVDGTFEITAKNRFTGTSGVSLFKKSSGFGCIVKGQGTRSNEVLIVTRGTVTTQDWCSNLNIGTQPGPSGTPVHIGFNQIFKSFKSDIDQFFRQNNPTHVHCVGHSLGGALATLVADHIRTQKIADVSLYSFGCPRVGTLAFGHQFSRELGKNIYRAFHTADPVSMIPLFPFRHVSTIHLPAELPWNDGRVSIDAHSMDSYIRTIGQQSWDSLIVPPQPINWGKRVGDWLESSSSYGMGMLSARLLAMIAKALAELVAKIALNFISCSITSGLTLLDQLASLLYQGAQAAKEIAEQLGFIMRATLRFLGRVLSSAANLTLGFIRWVLGMLFDTVHSLAIRATAAFS
ncbi:MAG: lipase [Candidatus Contendobacter odensis]|uniref:Lipase n=1 Tax=Candidatus Contendibacter odensensis TaxID=1400860 RepID=A0A2G6PFD7_9GAMM|nr:MAG: lipase [Candidatus Contendobacter odensis]